MRLIIAEDSVLFRQGLIALLEAAGHQVLAGTADATSAVELTRSLRPELVIFDVRMPPDSTDHGARAAAVLRAEFPRLGIVLLSQRLETKHTIRLAGAGYFAYLLKARVLDVSEFLEILLRVLDGGSALDPELVLELIGAARKRSTLESLTPREREVLALMAEGRTNIGIGQRFWLTTRTVETHVASILAKLEPSTTPQDHRRVLAVVAYLESRGSN